MTFDPHRVNQEHGELINELEELAEKWRGDFHHVRSNCADELEDVINDY